MSLVWTESDRQAVFGIFSLHLHFSFAAKFKLKVGFRTKKFNNLDSVVGVRFGFTPGNDYCGIKDSNPRKFLKIHTKQTCNRRQQLRSR